MNDLSERTLSILPARSRAKLESLLIDRAAAQAAYRAASDREQQARQEYGLAEGRYRDLASLGPGVGLEGNRFAKAELEQQAVLEDRLAAPVEAARKRLDLAIAARERANQRLDEHAHLWDVIGWLERVASLDGVRLEHCSVEQKKIRDPAADISRLRAELEALDAEWSEAVNAPALAADLKAHAQAEIDAIAAKGAPSVSVRSRGGSPIDLTSKVALSTREGISGVNIVGDAGASFFVWLLRDEIAAKITAMIDASSQDGAMTDDQREAAFARINARRLEIERIEEALIVTAEAEGRSIPRRPNADPRAILEVIEV